MAYVAQTTNRPTQERPGETGACGGGCKGCKALAGMTVEHGLSPWQLALGIIWAFFLPILGLVGGAVLASQWEESQPWLAVAAVCGGLVAGVAAGVVGRRLTLHVDAAAGCEG